MTPPWQKHGGSIPRPYHLMIPWPHYRKLPSKKARGNRSPKKIALHWKRNGIHCRIKRKEEGFPDEHGVVDELALRTPVGGGSGEKTEEEVDDVSQDDAKVIVGVEQLHHVDLVTLQ